MTEKGHFVLCHIISVDIKSKLCKVRKSLWVQRNPYLVANAPVPFATLILSQRGMSSLLVFCGIEIFIDFIRIGTGNPCLVARGAKLRRIGVSANRDILGLPNGIHMKDKVVNTLLPSSPSFLLF